MDVTFDISSEQQIPWLSGSCGLSALSSDTPTSIFSVLGLQAQALPMLHMVLRIWPSAAWVQVSILPTEL